MNHLVRPLPPARTAAWVVWSVLAALPWLLPTHAQPWTSFHADAAMAVAAAALLVWAVCAGPARFHLPLPSLALGLLALVPPVQRACGRIDFAGDAWLATLYLLGLAAAFAVGARAQQLRPWVLAGALFASVALAACVSLGLMLVQWSRWDGLGTLVMALPEGARLSANLGQPNHLATLLAWGLVALWWTWRRGRLPGTAAAALAACMLAGIAMTQSRTGALEVALLALAAVAWRRQLHAERHAAVFVALGLWFVAAFTAWAPLNDLLGRLPGQSLGDRMAPGTRWQHWRLLVEAIAEKPLAGWGWNQVVHAQVQLAAAAPATHEVVQYAHNLVLDLMLWNGVLLGAGATAALLLWAGRQALGAGSPERLLVFIAVAVSLLHAMLELPHGYALFLLPAGLWAGALHAAPAPRPGVDLPRPAVALASAGLLVGAGLVMREYLQLEEAWQAQRFHAARISGAAAPAVPEVVVLTNLQALLRFVQTEPKPAMTAEELAFLRRVVQRYPSPGGLFRYAWALAGNGQPTEATRTLELLCRVSTDEQCRLAEQAWHVRDAKEAAGFAALWPTGP